MSTTVQYKGNTLTTVSNGTKTLKTAGKYMEGDVSITDSSGNEQGTVWQDAEGYLHLDDESGISLQTKSTTPSETAQTIQPDAGYYALDKVNVSAISSTYVGSGITRRSSADLTNSLPSGVYRFIVPAGYYAEQATKDIAKYDLPTPTISIDNSTGVITATSFLGNAGYINVGTKTATEQLTLRDSDDLTVSGATVTAPSGYYSAAASKSVASMTLPTAASTSATSGYTKKATIGRSTSKQYINIGTGYNNTGGYYEISAVANGSASAPTSISGSTATVSTGTNTLTLTKTVSVTPVVSAGYVSSGTATNSSVSLTASVAINPTPTASGATVTIPAGYYSAKTSKSVASGTAGTPTATKGTVSNHSVSVTPSVTNTTGYITGGTKTGTAVSVSASELVSGTKAITENGTDIDVTNYASVDVAVPTGEDLPKFTVNYDTQTSEPDTVTCNWTYSEIDDWVNNYPESGAGALVEAIWDYRNGTVEKSISFASLRAMSDRYVFIISSGGIPYLDINYYTDETITTSSPSTLQTLTVTENGTYTAPTSKLYNEVNVNVPSSAGASFIPIKIKGANSNVRQYIVIGYYDSGKTYRVGNAPLSTSYTDTIYLPETPGFQGYGSLYCVSGSLKYWPTMSSVEDGSYRVVYNSPSGNTKTMTIFSITSGASITLTTSDQS